MNLRALFSCTIITAALAIPFPSAADDVAGADRLLCASLEAGICTPGDGCAVMSPADLNIPQFIELDVADRRLSTTAASGENRQTIAQLVERTDGRLLLQGQEKGRAFSLMIDEATGNAAFASVANDRTVSVFAACTPLDAR